MTANERRGRIRWGLLIALPLAVLAGAWAYQILDSRPPADGFEFTATFFDPGSLSEGDPVKLNGNTIGEVSGIEPHSEEGKWAVHVRLYRDAEVILAGPPEGTAIITESGWLRRGAHLEIVQPESGGTPLAEGGILPGLGERNNSLGDHLARARMAAEQGLQQAREASEGLRQRAMMEVDVLHDRLREIADGPEAEALRQQFDTFRQEVTQAGEQGAEQARDAARRAVEEGRKLIESLRLMGRDDLAEEVSESVGLLRESEEMESRAEEEGED